MRKCLFVCLSATYLQNCRSDSHEIFTHVTYGRGPILLWRRCDLLYTSGFMDDVTFTHNWPYDRGTSIDTAAASDVIASSCAGYSTAVASYWLRRVLDDGGRRD